MPIFDEGGNTGAARSTLGDAILSLFDKDRRKKVSDQRQPEDGKHPEDEQDDKRDSKWW